MNTRDTLLRPRRLKGKEITHLREKVGDTRQEFAQALHVSANYIARVEADYQPLGPSSDKLARAYTAARLGYADSFVRRIVLSPVPTT